MKFTLIASLLFVSLSLFANEATDESAAGEWERLGPCKAGSMVCTAEYDPHTCDIVFAHNGQFVRSVSGGNRCGAAGKFRSRQCEAHLQNPLKYADASAFSVGNCRKN